jgi:hypothetical protein
MWSDHLAGQSAVEKVPLSPGCLHSENPLCRRLRGIIPVVHTLYDYDKGIS